jgi:hypothetical protein
MGRLAYHSECFFHKLYNKQEARYEIKIQNNVEMNALNLSTNKSM